MNDIYQALQASLRDHRGKTEEEAKDAIEQWKEEERYGKPFFRSSLSPAKPVTVLEVY